MCCSILGMNLFGCKFCTKNGPGPPTDESSYDDSECDRKNFDSLLWALVTVFQVPYIISGTHNDSVYIYKHKFTGSKF